MLNFNKILNFVLGTVLFFSIYFLGFFFLSKNAYAQSCGGTPPECWKGKSMLSCAGGSEAGHDCIRNLDCPGRECKAYPWCDSADQTSGSCGSPVSCSASCPSGYCEIGGSCVYIPQPTNTPVPPTAVPQPTATPDPGCSYSCNYHEGRAPDDCGGPFPDGGSCTATQIPAWQKCTAAGCSDYYKDTQCFNDCGCGAETDRNGNPCTASTPTPTPTPTSIPFYTIGQRHGIGVYGGGAPYFVIAKNVKQNRLIVGNEIEEQALFSKTV